MKIAAFQMDIAWCDPIRNHAKVEAALEKLEPQTQLFVVPEMFTTGFTMSPAHCAVPEPLAVEWLSKLSAHYRVAIAGSVAISENGAFYNRYLFVEPSGRVTRYDKHHLFRMGGEHEVYSSGNERVIVEFQGIRFLLAVCYDLRFPVWLRNRGDYDAILMSANWPESRNSVWDTLLKARAIENQCYVVGVNRVGSEPTLDYCGNSLIVNYKGDVISRETLNTETLLYGELEPEKLAAFREKFPTWKDADSFELK